MASQVHLTPRGGAQSSSSYPGLPRQPLSSSSFSSPFILLPLHPLGMHITYFFGPIVLRTPCGAFSLGRRDGQAPSHDHSPRHRFSRPFDRTFNDQRASVAINDHRCIRTKLCKLTTNIYMQHIQEKPITRNT
jgi:hypothetical protein